MIVGAFVFPVGIFWFAWTSFPTINVWPQIISGVPIGFGIMAIYLQGLAYLVDVYTINANSAISANGIVRYKAPPFFAPASDANNTYFRSIVAAGFVMFATPMYNNLGVQWATSVLAFLATAFIPVPILFHRYGARIRKMSKYSPK